MCAIARSPTSTTENWKERQGLVEDAALLSIPELRIPRTIGASLAVLFLNIANSRRSVLHWIRFDIGGPSQSKLLLPSSTITNTWSSKSWKTSSGFVIRITCPYPISLLSLEASPVESGAVLYKLVDQKLQNDKELWYMIDGSFITHLPDAWGLNQNIFYLALNKWDDPFHKVNIGGLTCDSHDYYNSEAHTGEVFLPMITDEEPLYIGFFHTGAYQEALGVWRYSTSFNSRTQTDDSLTGMKMVKFLPNCLRKSKRAKACWKYWGRLKIHKEENFIYYWGIKVFKTLISIWSWNAVAGFFCCFLLFQ